MVKCSDCSREYINHRGLSNHLRFGCTTIRSDEIKESRREYNKSYYSKPKWREWYRKYAKHYEKLPSRKEWQKEYRQRDYVKQANKIYSQKPESRNRAREYWRSEHGKEVQRLKSRRLRLLVIQSYGNKCACCSETKYEFLSIDHINGGGSKHRKEIGGQAYLCRWLKKNSFPEGFRILCHNCNQSLGHYGYCPHTNPMDDGIMDI